MSVLDRASLEASPLADIHAIASELSIDGYRRLRRADLIDAIVARQDGTEPPSTVDEEAGEAADGDGTAAGRRRRGRRGGRGRGAARADSDEPAEAEGAVADAGDEPESEDEEAPEEPVAPRARRGRRSSRAAAATAAVDEESEAAPEPEAEAEAAAPDEREDEVVEGVVELLVNGSGFLRVAPPDPSDDDVYISAAQVKRCELVGGDRIAGPKRSPRRSERFASLIRVDSINGRPASELADGVRFEDLPAAFPSERFRLGSDDPTLKSIEWLTPFGRGSRVTITGGPWAGKSHALRSLADALAAEAGVSLFVALAGVRPEEISDWSSAPLVPAGAVSFAASVDAQDHVVELVVDQARRIAARGGTAVVLIDTLDGLHVPTARKLMAAARNIVDGGSLTVIATSTRPVGGETTVIALDPTLTSTGRFPALDLVASGTLRPDLLVGAAGAQAIADARAEAHG